MNKEQVINDNIKLVAKIAHRLYIPTHLFDVEDLIQVGLSGLVKSLDRYDPERAKLSTFITTCVRNDIIKFLQKQFKFKTILCDEALLFEESSSSTVLDLQDYFPNNSDDLVTLTELKMSGLTDEQIGLELGISKKKVKKMTQKLKRQLQKEFDA